MSNANNKISKLKYLYLILIFPILLISGTYAYQQLGKNNNSVTGKGGCFNVNYTGQNITTSNLFTTSNFIEGSKTTITLQKNSSCKLYTEANIYIKINNNTTAPIETIPALKYKLLDSYSQISEGTITTKNDFLLATVPLTDTSTTYTVYLYIDPEISIGQYDSKTFSGYVYAESSQTSTIEGHYLVNFDTNNGKNQSLSKTVTTGQTYGWLPTPNKEGYNFVGWSKNIFNKNATPAKSSYYIKGDGSEVSLSEYSIYIAYISPNTTYTITNSGQSTNPGYVLYDSNNNRIGGANYNNTQKITFTTPENTSYIKFSVVTQTTSSRYDKDTFQLEKSNTATTYENYQLYTNNTAVAKTENHTLSAIWTPATHTVRFNANGGTVSQNSMQVTYGNTYGTLPTATKSGYTFKGWSILPADYQELEYLQNSGTQYIDMGLKGTQNSSFDLNFMITTIAGRRGIFGHYNGHSGSFYIYTSSTENLQYGYNGYENVGNALQANVNYRILSSGNNVTINGNSYSNGSSGKFTTSQNLILFNITGGTYTGLSMKVYSFKLYESNEIVRNLVPCYNTNTSQYGMYDIVNGNFYPNAATSGNDFTGGSNIYTTSSTIVTQDKDHVLTAVWE